MNRASAFPVGTGPGTPKHVMDNCFYLKSKKERYRMDQRGFRIFGLDTSFSSLSAGRDSFRVTRSDQRIELAQPIPHSAVTPGQRETIPFKQPANKSTPSKPAECKTSMATIRLRDLMPVLLDAADCGRAWVRDFGDDPVTISQDLYEVLLAYQSLRKAA